MCNVEILTGPPGSGKTQTILNEILPAVTENRCHMVMVLVSSNLKAEAIREAILAQKGVNGFIGLRILTFLDLCMEIFQESPFPGRVNTPLARKWMVQAILAEMPLQHLVEVRETRGLMDLVVDLIRTLKDGGVSSEEFLKKSLSAQASPRIIEAARIYHEYETRRRTRGLLDREDLFPLAAGILEQNPGSMTRLQKIFVTGFYDFTPIQLRLLAALSGLRNIEGIFITLPHVHGTGPGSTFTRRTLDRLDSVWPHAIIKPLSADEKDPVDPLHHLRKHFLNSEEIAPRIQCKGSIRILNSPGAYREVEEIARKIRRLQYGQGLSFKDFAVVFRSLGDYQDKVTEVFRSHGIPIRMGSGLPLRSNPLVRTVMGILEIPLGGYRREAVVRLIRSDYIRFEPLLKENLPPERFDILSREAMVHGGKEEWESRFASRIQYLDLNLKLLQQGSLESEELEKREERIKQGTKNIGDYQACARIIRALFKTIEALPGKAAPGRFAEAIEEMVRSFRMEEQISACPELRLVRRDQRGLDALRELLAQMVREYEASHSGMNIPLSEFVRILNHTLSEAQYIPDPPAEDAVLVTDAPGMRGLRRPVVFIGGLVEEVFPRAHPPDPLFREKDRIILNKTLGPDRWITLASHRREEEEVLFLLCAASAARTLYLTYPRTDAEGRELLSSRFMDRVWSLFEEGAIEKKEVSINDPLPDPEDIFRDKELLEYTFLNLSRPASVNPEAPSLFNLLARTRPHKLWPLLHGLRVTEDRNSGDGPYSGLLGAAAAALLREQEAPFSVTALERYGACPFTYFCERELKVQPVEEVEDEVEARDLGSLYHRILQRFYAAHLRETGTGINADNLEQARKNMHRTAEEELNRAEARGIPGHRKIWEVRKEEVHRTLDRFIDQEVEEHRETGDVPSHFEACFGMKPFQLNDPISSTEPLTMDSETGKIRILGKVDRIDLSTSGDKPFFSIVDYKSGKSAPGAAQIMKGESLQLPVYAAWAGTIFSNQRELKNGSFYLLRSGEKKTQIQNDENFKELMEASMRYIREYVEAIRQGKFPVTQKKCPDYCELSPVCRIREG
ncbi:MAG: PD-(D/E)XK nuclease family protein [bacterium]